MDIVFHFSFLNVNLIFHFLKSFTFIFMCVHVHMCHGTLGEIKGYLAAVSSHLLLHIGPRDQTQIIWLDMSIYALKHLIGLRCTFICVCVHVSDANVFSLFSYLNRQHSSYLRLCWRLCRCCKGALGIRC